MKHRDTHLHLDATSSVTVLMHEQAVARPGAVWLIFRQEHKERLCEYLKQQYNCTEDDPIHSHRFFIDDADLQRLAKDGVYPHHFVQHQGQAVFVNAGCAYQVRFARLDVTMFKVADFSWGC